MTAPLIAQAFRRADQMLGPQSADTEFIAVVANPLYRSVSVVDSFDRQEDLHRRVELAVPDGLPGGPHQGLEPLRGAGAVGAGRSGMVDHSEVAFVIDPEGRMRAVLPTNPGTSAASDASLSSLVTQELRGLLP